MIKQLLIHVLMVGSTIAVAQIDNTTFINIDDVISYNRDLNTIVLEAQVPDNDLYDFSELVKNTSTKEVYSDASKGTFSHLYPAAEMVSSNLVEEKYYSKNNNQFSYLGSSYKNLPQGIPDIVLNGDSVIIHQVPMNVGDVIYSQATFETVLSSEFLPDSITDQFPVAIDSISVRQLRSHTLTAKGSGLLKLPNDRNYNSMKVEILDDLQFKFYAKSLFGWIDVTEVVKEAYPQIEQIFEEGEFIQFAYYSNGISGPILSYDLVGTDTLSDFKYQEIKVSVQDYSDLYESRVFPNPAVEFFILDSDYTGDCIMEIRDINGRALQKANYFAQGQLQVSTNRLPNGQYFIILKDNNHNILAKEKITVAK